MEFLPKEPYKKVFCIVFYAVLIFILLFVLFISFCQLRSYIVGFMSFCGALFDEVWKEEHFQNEEDDNKFYHNHRP